MTLESLTNNELDTVIDGLAIAYQEALKTDNHELADKYYAVFCDGMDLALERGL